MDIVTVLANLGLVAAAFTPHGDAQPPVIACRLDALTPEEQTLQKELRARVERGTTRVLEDAEGFTFQYGADVAPAAVIAWVELERKCCPFLRFTLDVPEEGGPSRLRVWGTPGVKAFLAAQVKTDKPQDKRPGR